MDKILKQKVVFEFKSITLPITKQAERLKSRERRPAVDRLDGQWAPWSIGLMVIRLDGR